MWKHRRRVILVEESQHFTEAELLRRQYRPKRKRGNGFAVGQTNFFCVWCDAASGILQWGILQNGIQHSIKIIDRFRLVGHYTGATNLLKEGCEFKGDAGCDGGYCRCESARCDSNCTLKAIGMECGYHAHNGRDCGNKELTYFLLAGTEIELFLDFFPLLGIGLRTGQFLRINQIIGVYWGEIIPTKSQQKRQSKHSYLAEVTEQALVDASRTGSILRYVNASCEPNLSMQCVVVSGSSYVFYKSIRNIWAGEDLTVSYNDHDWKGPCRCGKHSCTGRWKMP